MAGRSMGRPLLRARAGGLAAIAVAVVLATACSTTGNDKSVGPAQSLTPTTPATTTGPPATSGDTIPISAAPDAVFALAPWWLTDAGLVQGQPRFVTGPDVIASALEQLIAGPTDADKAQGLGTNISPRVQILSLKMEGDTATVNLSRPFETADTQPQVAQVVWTLTELSGITHVKFLIDGEDNGATGVVPLGRDQTRVQPAG